MASNNTLKETDFALPGQKSLYRGKVRDVYTLENDILVMVASDRISAFDVVLPEAIPYKGLAPSRIATRLYGTDLRHPAPSDRHTVQRSL